MKMFPYLLSFVIESFLDNKSYFKWRLAMYKNKTIFYFCTCFLNKETTFSVRSTVNMKVSGFYYEIFLIFPDFHLKLDVSEQHECPRHEY